LTKIPERLELDFIWKSKKKYEIVIDQKIINAKAMLVDATMFLNMRQQIVSYRTAINSTA
jgi:hypothetical protein